MGVAHAWGPGSLLELVVFAGRVARSYTPRIFMHSDAADAAVEPLGQIYSFYVVAPMAHIKNPDAQVGFAAAT